MNTINGSTRVTEKDKENIREMADAGMNFRVIARITGWSYETVRRIATGSHDAYLEKAKAYNKKRNEIEKDSICEEIPVLDGFQEEMLKYVKNLNILLFAVEQKLERICLALGVGDGRGDE